tara:strand:- start:71 stop:1258 length:1188 start_codon:yes stop_codon:yes gene_type:complete
MSKASSSKKENTGQMLGVVGGGQLAQMLVEAAIKRNIDVAIQTSSDRDPAVSKAKNIVLSSPESIDGTRQMAKECCSVTFENEWVNIEELKVLEKEGVEFIPKLDSLSPLVDKISQKRLLSKLNIPGPDWLPLSSAEISSISLPSNWQFPLMAKASRGGYDGKGTRVINDFKELSQLIKDVEKKGWLVEKWVKYEKEYSLVMSRDMKGKIYSFPLVETYQYNQVCDWVVAPAEADHSVEVMAYNIAASLLTELNYFGVITIEFFYGENGLFVNEIAPRTHNSAHYSIEACRSSQFDQQVCIAAGLPVISPDLIVPGALMINLLGLNNASNYPLEKRLEELNNIRGAHLHWYNKEEEKPGRKLGHVTFLLKSQDATSRRSEAMNALKAVRSIWPTN